MNVLTSSSSGIAHGLLTIHAAPQSLCAHIDWSISDVFGQPFRGDWKKQPLKSSHYRLEIPWQGKSGAAARLASTLAGWEFLYFEITQAAALGSEGEFYRFTPQLKMHHSTINSFGEIVISENQILTSISQCREPALVKEKMRELLGTSWEDELEPFRIALRENELDFEDKMSV